MISFDVKQTIRWVLILFFFGCFGAIPVTRVQCVRCLHLNPLFLLSIHTNAYTWKNTVKTALFTFPSFFLLSISYSFILSFLPKKISTEKKESKNIHINYYIRNIILKLSHCHIYTVFWDWWYLQCLTAFPLCTCYQTNFFNVLL